MALHTGTQFISSIIICTATMSSSVRSGIACLPVTSNGVEQLHQEGVDLLHMYGGPGLGEKGVQYTEPKGIRNAGDANRRFTV